MKKYFALLTFTILCFSNCKQKVNEQNTDESSLLVQFNESDSYNTARKKFKTKLIKNSQTDLYQDKLEQPPKDIYNLITYKSATGEDFSAYITPAPTDNKKHPVILFARGGHGGLTNWMWQPDFFMMPAIKDPNIVVMVPAWRGDNYQGKLELYLGEVDDAIAAIEKLKSLPYVDPDRIYMMGHSTGGTTTQMTALASNDIKAAFSFGGVTDIFDAYSGTDYKNAPFDINNYEECYIRSLHNYVDELKTPTYYLEGSQNNYMVNLAKKTALKATKTNAPFKAFSISGADHNSYIYDFVEKVIVPKINTNTDFKTDKDLNESSINAILSSN